MLNLFLSVPLRTPIYLYMCLKMPYADGDPAKLSLKSVVMEINIHKHRG